MSRSRPVFPSVPTFSSSAFVTKALKDGACPSLTARSTRSAISSGIVTATLRLIPSSYSAGPCAWTPRTPAACGVHVGLPILAPTIAAMSGSGTYGALLDYRRQVDALYADVRRLAATDPATAHEHWRRVRDGLFAEHPQSAVAPEDRGRFKGLSYYPYDPQYRFTAPLIEDPKEPIEVQTSTGEAMRLRPIGHVELALGMLPVFWIDAYSGGVLIPLRDATSGDTTYGGGRYLLDTAKGADLGSNDRGELILDLNFAYHPSCHYNYRWSCPLAGPESRLDARVEAGEMSWEGAPH